MLYFNNKGVEEKQLDGLSPSSLSQEEKKQINLMMEFLKVSERELYILSLELMRKEIESQKRMLRGITELMKEMRLMQEEDKRKSRRNSNINVKTE